MDIACPSCAAAYEIDEATVTPSGRKVRCADCTTIWRVFPAGYHPVTGVPMVTGDVQEAIIPSTEAPPTEVIEPETAPSAPRGAKWAKDKQQKKSKAGATRFALGWPSVAIAACLLILAGGLHQRERVVRYVPQMAKLYAAIGMPVNLRGIAIVNVASRVVNDNDESVLVVDGDLVNVTNRKVDVPRLYFSVLGKDGQQVFAWSAQADRATLQPGEKLNFRRRLAAPPADSKDVSVRFLTRSDITAGIR